MSTKLRTIQGLAIGLLLLVSLVVPIHARAASPALDEQIIADAYVYLIGRALVVRQEHLDVAAQGGYNVAFHNRLGSADFVNPNLGVANTEAWIAVDDATPVVLEIPKIEGRYYTAQILDEWGETLTNIHERSYPLQPYGKFAFVAPGSRVAIPEDAVRIELRSYKAKMLARVELQNDRDGAVALQRQIRITPLGKPKFPPAVKIPTFDHAQLVGVELFDATEDLLKSAPDVSPIAAQLQAQVRAVALAAKDPAQRAAIDKTLRDQVIPRFMRYATQEGGQVRNNWLGTAMILGNYGEEFWTRSGANLIGIAGRQQHLRAALPQGRAAAGRGERLLVGPPGRRPGLHAGSQPARPLHAQHPLQRREESRRLADPRARTRAGRRRSRGELAADGAREAVLLELASLCPEGDRPAGQLVPARGREA